jgi:hypothetical protein
MFDQVLCAAPGGDGAASAPVTGEDGGAQAVDAVVGGGDGGGFVAHGDDRGHGAEKFFGVGGAAGADTGEHGGRVEITGAG